MKNILKLGLISAVTAIALAQTPAQTMDEDVLAIASKGALSDKMQGFRKLADDEAGSIWGGLNYIYSKVNEGGTADSYKFLMSYYAYYPMELTNSEKNGQRLNIGAGESYSDYNEFVQLAGGVNKQLYIRLEVNFQTSTSRQFIVNSSGQAIGNNSFTSRLANFANTYYYKQFNSDRVQFARTHGYY